MHTQWKSQDRAKLNRCNDGKRNKEKNMSQMTSHCNGNASHSKNSPSLSVCRAGSSEPVPEDREVVQIKVYTEGVQMKVFREGVQMKEMGEIKGDREHVHLKRSAER